MRDITSVSETTEIDIAKVLAADPLCLDPYFQEGLIAEMNVTGDIGSLIRLGTEILYGGVKIDDQVVAHATARDLGIVIGSIARLVVNPFEVLPELRPNLERLRDQRGMSPYHTVFDYSLWNPSGSRRRSFTGTEQEEIFIEQVNLGIISLLKVNSLIKQVDVHDPESANKVLLAVECFQPMIRAIPEVMKKVGAKFFAENLRPFFNPIELDGVIYEAPGGAQLPIIITDRVVWAGETVSDSYKAFVERNLVYMPPALQRIFSSNNISTLVEQVQDFDRSHPVRMALNSFLTALISFRRPHEKLARDSFGHRQEDAVGSGGYTPDLLTELIQLTDKNRDRKSNER